MIQLTNTAKKIDITRLPDDMMIHKFTSQDKKLSKKLIGVGILIIIAGIFSGYMLSSFTQKTAGTSPGTSAGTSPSKGKVVVGSTDTKQFSDSAEGTLEVGGINGEGTHKLIRSGGESQTVYLTSSVLDLNQFVGRKVRVWGQTFAAKKAGWLMDVGRLETLD